jgi:hypothetical protein
MATWVKKAKWIAGVETVPWTVTAAPSMAGAKSVGRLALT